MNLLLQYIRYHVSLGQKEEEAIKNTFKVKSYQKGHLLLHEGAVCDKMYFVLKGTCRTFHDHAKKEVTTWIYPENHFITSWSSFLLGTPSSDSIQILENDSEVAFITKTSLHQLYEKYHVLERFGRQLAEEQLASIDDYARGYHLMSAREKYQLLLSFFPDVTQRVNLGYVASLLGITQETLSRIRKQP